MSKVEEEARAAEYRRSTQARYDFWKVLEDMLAGSAERAAELHSDYDALIPDAGWNPIERTLIREDDQK